MADVSGQKQFVTDQHVLAGIGSKTEHYPFIAMSSGKFTEVCTSIMFITWYKWLV